MSLFVLLLLLPSNSAPSYSSLAPAVKGRRDDCSLARAQRKGRRGREERRGESIVTISPSNNRTVCLPLAKLCLARGKHWSEKRGGAAASSERAAGWVVYYTRGQVGGGAEAAAVRQVVRSRGETTPTNSWHFVWNPSKSGSFRSDGRSGRGPRRAAAASGHRPNTKY